MQPFNRRGARGKVRGRGGLSAAPPGQDSFFLFFHSAHRVNLPHCFRSLSHSLAAGQSPSDSSQSTFAYQVKWAGGVGRGGSPPLTQPPPIPPAIFISAEGCALPYGR
jgi:hypothetical protein